MSTQLITRYYDAFNRGDFEGMLMLLHDEVVHDINQAGSEQGVPAFRTFLARMSHCYSEHVHSLVVMHDASGQRFAAEFIVSGMYVHTDPGFLEARGQRYELPVGAFFEVRDGLIARVTNYYNVRDWLAQVS